MERNNEEIKDIDERSIIKKSNINTIYLIIALSIIIQFIFSITGRPTSVRRDTLLTVLMSLGGAVGMCIFPIIIAFISNWKKGIYSEKFRKVFVITWIIILVLLMIGKFAT